MQQAIKFLKAPDGVTLAWAEAGTGPTLVKAANWLSHLEFDWNSPVWRHWIRFFAEHYHFLRYDERGCGMSDWDVEDISWQKWTSDLDAVITIAKPEKPFILVGISQGGVAAVDYAARHPENVSHLILYGIYAQGPYRRGDPNVEKRTRALIDLTRLGWGQDNPVYRQLFTSRFIPKGTTEQFAWFNELCQKTTNPDTAARLIEARTEVDIADRLGMISVPTLVMHARGDDAVPLSQGRLVAAEIPDAEFVLLESANHILLETEPAWERFKSAVLDFTGRPAADAQNEDPVFARLSPRERDILAHIADGLTNAEIGRKLFISEKTVRNILTKIFEKLDVKSRAQAIILTRDRQFAMRSSENR
jgi:pimeloyl-ACP methyl ester carboxylesterase/DNA-binding CsgD family transcriptional regulator